MYDSDVYLKELRLENKIATQRRKEGDVLYKRLEHAVQQTYIHMKEIKSNLQKAEELTSHISYIVKNNATRLTLTKRNVLIFACTMMLLSVMTTTFIFKVMFQHKENKLRIELQNSFVPHALPQDSLSIPQALQFPTEEIIPEMKRIEPLIEAQESAPTTELLEDKTEEVQLAEPVTSPVQQPE